ncbi:hypothetical protein CSUI_007923, partial [Cystoisospora suis]
MRRECEREGEGGEEEEGSYGSHPRLFSLLDFLPHHPHNRQTEEKKKGRLPTSLDDDSEEKANTRRKRGRRRRNKGEKSTSSSSFWIKEKDFSFHDAQTTVSQDRISGKREGSAFLTYQKKRNNTRKERKKRQRGAKKVKERKEKECRAKANELLKRREIPQAWRSSSTEKREKSPS